MPEFLSSSLRVIPAPYEGEYCHRAQCVYRTLRCSLWTRGLLIGDKVLIAGRARLVTTNHGFSSPNQSIRTQSVLQLGIRIMDDVRIGCDVQVLDGVTTGSRFYN